MAKRTYYDALLAAGVARRADVNELFGDIQDEFEKRWGLVRGFLAVPALAVDNVNQRVTLSDLDCMIDGACYDDTGAWQFAADASGTYYLQVMADGTLSKSTTEDTDYLTVGTVVWHLPTLTLSAATVTAAIGYTIVGQGAGSVTSVNGKTGIVTLTTTDIAEGSRRYFTDARADARIAAARGAANGIAPLGADSKVPEANLPAVALGDGDVSGPASATVGRLAKFTNADGKEIGETSFSEAQAQVAITNSHTHANKSALDAYSAAAFEPSGAVTGHEATYDHADLGQVLVDAADTAAGYLDGKLLEGSNVTFGVDTDPGTGEKTLTINAAIPGGTGDMSSAIYDTDADGIVDQAASINDGAGNSATAEDLADAVDQAHEHVNLVLLETYTQTEVDLAAAVAASHDQDTDTGTSGNAFAIGDGADSTKTLTFETDDVDLPGIRFNHVTGTIQLRIRGGAWADVATDAEVNGPLGNYSAAVAPGVTDDEAAGYEVGSLWIDTVAEEAYVCIDASEGAAVWHQIDGTGSGSGPLSNFTAIIAPVVTDDETEGYEVGSLWVDTVGGAAYICVDATEDAAVWEQIDGAAGSGPLNNFAAVTAPGVSDDDGDGYEVGSLWINVTLDRAYICLDASTGAAVWRAIDAYGDTGGGSIDQASSGLLLLANDSAAPGNSKYYGTSSVGAKGWHALPAGGGGGGPMLVTFPATALGVRLTAYPARVVTNGTNVLYEVLQLDDTTEEFATGEFLLPDDLDTAGDVNVIIVGQAITPSLGSEVQFNLYHSAIGVSGDIDAAYDTESLTAVGTDAGGGLDMFEEAISVATLGWAAGEVVRFMVSRDNSGMLNLAGDYGLYAVVFELPRA